MSVPAAAALGWKMGAPALGCALVVAVLALYWALTGAGEHGDTDDSLRHHLAVARRRNESVDLLVLRADAGTADAARISATLRVTDSVYLTRFENGWELQAMVDCDQLDREALRSRVSEVAGFALNIGWARFPQDGYTLGILVARARAALELASPATPPAWSVPEAAPDLLVAPANAAPAQAATK